MLDETLDGPADAIVAWSWPRSNPTSWCSPASPPRSSERESFRSRREPLPASQNRVPWISAGTHAWLSPLIGVAVVLVLVFLVLSQTLEPTK